MASRIIVRTSSSFINGHRIDNADNRGVHRRRLPAQRVAGGAPFEHDQDFFVYTRPDSIDGQQGIPARRIVDIQRLDQEQLGTFKRRVLPGRNHRPDDASYLHPAVR
jgi:hypothetical protein